MRLLLLAHQLQQYPMILVCRNVVKQLHRTVQHRDDHVDVAVIVEVSESDSTVRGVLRKIGAGAGTHILKLAVAQIAKDRIRLRVLALGNQAADIVENIGARHKQVLPAIVVEVDDPVSPA